MKRNIIIVSIFLTLIAMPGAYANTESNNSAANTQNAESPAESTAEPSAEPSPASSSSSEPVVSPTPDPAPSHAPGMAPGERGGWAMIDDSGKTINIIVCTPEVCGSGWFAGARVVLQTLQDPVEAATSPNREGNVAAYMDGRYNFETNRWTIPGRDNSINQIPLAYPGIDKGGNSNFPICIENCPDPNLNQEVFSQTNNESQPLSSSNNSTEIVQRSVAVKPEVLQDSLVITKKLENKILKNKITIVATKDLKKKVWTRIVKNNLVDIRIPKKYLTWKISIRYTLV